MHNPFARPDRSSEQNGLDRRSFLTATGSLAAAAVWSSRAWGVTKRTSGAGRQPVSAGRRLGRSAARRRGALDAAGAASRSKGAACPTKPSKSTWQVAEDEQMTQGRPARARPSPSPAGATRCTSKSKGCSPSVGTGTSFAPAGETSPKGRTRTTPAAGRHCPTAAVRLRLVPALGKRLLHGLRAHAQARTSTWCCTWAITFTKGPAAPARSCAGTSGRSSFELDDYRNRHAQYKTDPALQAMHAAVPWLVTWDDHEFENNCAGLTPEHPDRRPPRSSKAATRRRLSGLLRAHAAAASARFRKGHDMQLYRRMPFGQLAEFFVLDTRQYRTDQPCGDGIKAPGDAVLDPNGTMLGEAQRNWLFDRLGRVASANGTCWPSKS